MPPEAAVLTGQQGIHQHLWKGIQLRQLAVTLALRTDDRLALAVVQGQGTPHRRQAAADRQLQHPQAEGGQADGGYSCQAEAAEPRQPLQAGELPAVELQLRHAGQMLGAEAHRVPLVEQQLLHPAAVPPQPIGGAVVQQQPVAPAALQQTVLAAHGGMGQADFAVTVPSQPVGTAVQLHPARALPWQVQQQQGLSHRWPAAAGSRPPESPAPPD